MFDNVPRSSDLEVQLHPDVSRPTGQAERTRHRARAMAQLAQQAARLGDALPDLPREERLDAARRRDVLRRQELAMNEHAEHMRKREAAGRQDERPSALVVHRQPWFRERVTSDLQQLGLRVAACVDNGADGVGIAVAEQPDVLVLDEHVAMMTSAAVLRQLATYCPSTRVLVQAEGPGAREEYLRDGAAEVVSRAVPPADVATAALLLAGLDAAYPA